MNPINPGLAQNFATNLLQWWDRHGRHDLPWQMPRDEYRVWLSEVMLQQTQVATVVSYFNRFVARFPNIPTLAQAPLDEVLHLWTGLGYYARARNLHATAQRIVREYNGEFPREQAALMDLPGVGRSTAAAILAQAFDQPAAILDGNVKRVLTRWRGLEGWPGDTKITQALWYLAEQLTPSDRVADYTQAIMDLGATLCTRQRPLCGACPVGESCVARQSNRVAHIPSPKPRKVRPLRSLQLLLIQDADGAWLLQRRSQRGVWFGLFSFPEIDLDADHANAIATLLSDQGMSVAEVFAERTLPLLRHGFTHYELQAHPRWIRLRSVATMARDGGAWLWYRPGQQQVGLSKVVTRLIAEVQELALSPPLQI